MKRLRAFIFTSLLVTAICSTTVFAGTVINVTLNGDIVKFTDAVPYVDNTGRTMMPVAKMGELLGVEVGWDNSTQTVTLKEGNKLVSLQIGSNILNIDGMPTTMDTKAVSKNGRTYVPLSAIAKAFGTEVSWDGATSTISLKVNSSSMFDWISGKGDYTTEDYSIINQNARNLYALDGDDFYFVDYKAKEFKRLNVVTEEEEVLLENCNYTQEMYITDEYIFFNYYDDFSRMNKDGTGLTKFPYTQEGLQVYGDKIYYYTHPELKLYVTDFEFTSPKEVKQGFVCSDFKIYDDKVITIFSDRVKILDLNTLQEKTINLNNPHKGIGIKGAIDITEDNLLISTIGNEIFNVNINDGTVSNLHTDYLRSSGQHKSIAIDNKFYYIAKEGAEGVIEYDVETQEGKLLLGGKFSYLTYIEGHLIIKGTNNTNVSIIDLSTGKVVSE